MRLAFFLACAFLTCAAFAAPKTPWTQSRVVGSPEPPSDYITELAFPNLHLEGPTSITSAPGTDRFFVGLRNGRIVSFAPKGDVAGSELFLDTNVNLPAAAKDARGNALNRIVYGVAFHPKYESNGFVYVFITESWPQPRRTRIARFTRDPRNPLRAMPESEEIVLEFPSNGHNGGSLKFGPDGFLYIGTGDAFGQNDPMQTGQFLGDLLASILRIDIDGTHSVKPYRVPADNPFLTTPGAMPEIWAFGFRQPWKMSFDRKTGDLWVGEVGQDLWESVYRVTRGGNYGWSVKEGTQMFRPERPRGPGPILPPAMSHSHAEARSMTGGFVYRGSRLPELEGAYIYADWETGKIWGLRHDGSKATWHKELDDTDLDIVDFAEDHSGELFLMTHNDGRVYRLQRRKQDPAALERARSFPRLLSQTGLFRSTRTLEPASGLVPYEVNSPLWSDGAEKTRYIAIPGNGAIEVVNHNRWNFPVGTVLVKTFALGGRRLETRLLTLQPSVATREQWAGYVYVWNDAQTDAELIGKDSLERTYSLAGGAKQTWQFPSRTDCMICHNEKAGFALGLNTWQMNVGTQIAKLEQAGLFGTGPRGSLPKLPDPADAKVALADRARSYLHGNCAHCHQAGAGGNADIRLLFSTPVRDMAAVEADPLHGNMEVAGAKLITPGNPDKSAVLLRMATRQTGKMPHIGTLKTDDKAVALVREWIASMR